MARRKKKSGKLFILILFFIFLFTGYKYDSLVSWKDTLNFDAISITLSNMFRSEEKVEEAVFMVHFIDVGQGDSILLQSFQPGKPVENILVDAGGSKSAKKVISYLEEQHVEKLEAVVATYPRADHIGGFPGILKRFEVESVYMPKKVHTTKTFEKFVTAVKDKQLRAKASHAGMNIPMNGAEISILAPAEGQEYKELNNYSIVLSVKAQGRHFILAGDAGEISEQEQLKQTVLFRADVLKAGHHGNSTSSSWDYVKAVSPEYVVISCGKDNSYGLPSEETLQVFNRSECKILRTDESGTIVMKVEKGQLSVLKEK